MYRDGFFVVVGREVAGEDIVVIFTKRIAIEANDLVVQLEISCTSITNGSIGGG